jgi:hypothetical protein
MVHMHDGTYSSLYRTRYDERIVPSMNKLLGASLLLFPFADALLLGALGIGGLCFAIAFVKEFGGPWDTDPTRCPACKKDGLMRVQAGIRSQRIPLLHCRECGEAYRMFGATLYRDTGGCQLS